MNQSKICCSWYTICCIIMTGMCYKCAKHLERCQVCQVGPPVTGGTIPLSLSERLSAGITFAVGNTRAFAAVGQQGSVTTWGDPACGGNSGLVNEELKSKAFQLCYNEWVTWRNDAKTRSNMTWCHMGQDTPNESFSLQPCWGLYCFQRRRSACMPPDCMTVLTSATLDICLQLETCLSHHPFWRKCLVELAWEPSCVALACHWATGSAPYRQIITVVWAEVGVMQMQVVLLVTSVLPWLLVLSKFAAASAVAAVARQPLLTALLTKPDSGSTEFAFAALKENGQEPWKIKKEHDLKYAINTVYSCTVIYYCICSKYHQPWIIIRKCQVNVKAAVSITVHVH